MRPTLHPRRTVGTTVEVTKAESAKAHLLPQILRSKMVPNRKSYIWRWRPTNGGPLLPPSLLLGFFSHPLLPILLIFLNTFLPLIAGLRGGQLYSSVNIGDIIGASSTAAGSLKSIQEKDQLLAYNPVLWVVGVVFNDSMAANVICRAMKQCNDGFSSASSSFFKQRYFYLFIFLNIL